MRFRLKTLFLIIFLFAATVWSSFVVLPAWQGQRLTRVVEALKWHQIGIDSRNPAAPLSYIAIGNPGEQCYAARIGGGVKLLLPDGVTVEGDQAIVWRGDNEPIWPANASGPSEVYIEGNVCLSNGLPLQRYGSLYTRRSDGKFAVSHKVSGSEGSSLLERAQSLRQSMSQESNDAR